MGLFDRLGTGVGDFVAAYNKAVMTKQTSPLLGAMGQKYAADLPSTATEDDYIERRALVNSWVFSAILYIAGEVSANKLYVVQDQGDSVTIVKNHDFTKLLKQPNEYMNRSFLWFYTVLWMKLNGNAYWFKVLEGNKLVEIWPLPAADVIPIPDINGQFLEAYEYSALGRKFRIPPNLITHFFNIPNPFNVFLGLSELVAAQVPSETDRAMADWAKSFFKDDNVMPSAVINVSPGSGPQRVRVNPADILEMKRDLRESYGAGKRKTLITTAMGLSVEKLGWNPQEMDFLLGRKFTRKEIFEIYGIPEGMTQAEATEANSRTGIRIFKETVNARTLIPIAEEVTSSIIHPHYDENLEASYGEIRPGTREIEMLELDRSKGALTIDETRSRYWQLPSLPNGQGEKLYGGNTTKPGVVPENMQIEDRQRRQTQLQAVENEVKAWQRKALNAIKKGESPNVPFLASSVSLEVIELINKNLRFFEGLPVDSQKAAVTQFFDTLQDVYVEYAS